MVTKVRNASYVAQHKAAQAKPQRLKKTVVDPVTPVPQSSIHEDIEKLLAKHSVTVPSTTRVVINFITCAVIGAGIGYIGGLLLEMLVFSALAFTGSVFLSVAVHVLGVVATLYAAWKTGGWVNDFIMSDDVDTRYRKYSNVVRGWFSNSAMVTS